MCRVGLQDELVLEHLAHPGLLRLDRLVQLVEREVLGLERRAGPCARPSRTALPAPVNWTGSGTTRTNCRASAATTHSVHSRLIASARVLGATVVGEPMTITIWNAIAVALQSGAAGAGRGRVQVPDVCVALPPVQVPGEVERTAARPAR